MKKKIFSITVVMILILLGATTVSDARINIQHFAREKPTNVNKLITLGSATIFGDGIEINSDANATAIKRTFIRIDSNQQTVDFNISYSINCSGTDDIGIVLLYVQSNGINLGDNTIVTSEARDGDLRIENVNIKNAEILSYQIIAIYINNDPSFNKIDIDTGTSVITTPRTFNNNVYNHPLIKLLLNLPKIVRLLA